MDSRCAVRFLLVFCVAVLGLVQLNYSQTLTHHNSTEPSPLSQFSATSDFFKHQASNGGQPGIVSFSSAAGEVLVTKDVDLRNTLRKYAAFKKCSLNEAFAETVAYLKMVPMRDRPASEMVGAQALYSIVKQDVYRISAPQKFFDALPLNLLCIENGKRILSVEIYFLGVPTENNDSFRSMLIPGSFVSFNNKIPQVTPFATTASYKSETATAGGNQKPEGTFVVASETRTKVFPTFMGRLNDQGVASLLNAVKSDSASHVVMAPRISISPGQAASVSDASTRPFVVGVNRIEGEYASGHQPVIQPIEDGTMLMLRATGENGKIRLDADLALSQIESVGTYDYSDTARSGPAGENKPTARTITLQVPEQRLKQVHFSTLVEEGQTVFVDPVFQRVIETPSEKRQNKLSGKKSDKKPVESRILLMIKPRWIDTN